MREKINLLLVDERGQATVELVVLFPAVLILAVITLNVVNYLGVCASFDRVFSQQVRVYAASPSAGSNQGDAVDAIQTSLVQSYGSQCADVQVTVHQDGFGNSCFTGTVTYEPTLFGLNFRSILFGVDLPTASHQTSCVLNCYRSGVIL